MSQNELYQEAKKSREHSYSPYSGHKVGAAIQLKNGKIFSGCNVENSSYGGTICAERTAILKAVSECGPIQIEAVLVVTDSPEPWPPCGMCRQVIAEFAKPETPIHAANLSGVIKTKKFGEIFPDAFTPDYLKR